MAKIKFYYRGKSEIGNLTVRLFHSKEIDIRVSTDIKSERRYWYRVTTKNGNKVEVMRNLTDLSNLNNAEAKQHKKELESIKDKIEKKFIADFNSGVPITTEWLNKVINEATEILSKKDEIMEKANFIDDEKRRRLDLELDIKQKNLVRNAIQNVIDSEYYDNPNQIKIYKQLLNKIDEYELNKRTSLKTVEVTQHFINSFTAFLIKDLQHQLSTARKHCKSLIHAVKYQKKAFPNEVEITDGINDITYKKQKKSERKRERSEIVITLSFDELDQIHNTDVPASLLNAKKAILLGSEIGLRVSDYEKLTIENIKTNDEFSYWEFWNQKTGADVIVPITDRLKKFIEIYGYPKTDYSKSADVIINREMKEVCKLAGINEMVNGRKSQNVTVKGKETRRTVSLQYPKFELISTHALRRSFATNYFNILPNNLIMQITGHASETQLMDYINQTADKSDTARQMAEIMNKKHSEINKKKTLRIA